MSSVASAVFKHIVRGLSAPACLNPEERSDEVEFWRRPHNVLKRG